MDIVNGKNHYGFSDLPKDVTDFVWIEATKLAGWESPTEIGENGLYMSLEWLTFALTIERWISDITGCMDLPGELLQQLKDLEKRSHWEPLSKVEEFRRLLWLNHGCQIQNDLKMKCEKCDIDFKNDCLKKISKILDGKRKENV